MKLTAQPEEIISKKTRRVNNLQKEHRTHTRDARNSATMRKTSYEKTHVQTRVKNRQKERIDKVETFGKEQDEKSLHSYKNVSSSLLTLIKHRKRVKGGKRRKVPILQTTVDLIGNKKNQKQKPPPSDGRRFFLSSASYMLHMHDLEKDASFTVSSCLPLALFDLATAASKASPYLASVHPTEESITKKMTRKLPATVAKPKQPERKRSEPNTRSLRLHRQEPPMMNRSEPHTLVRMTFKYVGNMISIGQGKEHLKDEIIVMQQHCCGRENFRLFKGVLKKDEIFAILSRGHRTFPFSLTFFLNGQQVERVTTCCEHKYKIDRHKLPNACSSFFEILRIDGAQPCLKCMISQGKLKKAPADPTALSTGKRGKHSCQESFRYFRGSSNSSYTFEHVQADGPIKASSTASSSEVSSDSSPLTSEAESDSESDSSDVDSRLPSLNADDSSSTSSSDNEDSWRSNRVKLKKNVIKQQQTAKIQSPFDQSRKSLTKKE